jgi:glycosyltransferase involved in cell wall biosynthesis
MKNNNTSLVSVIIPVYKVEEFIHECIDSVINQTYENLEIILVDDSSPDKCPQICDDYAKKDSRIKVIHKTHSGISNTRNAGLKISKGEYVYFLDSDDFIDKDAIESLLYQAQYYSADFVFFNLKRIRNTKKLGHLSNNFTRKELYSNPLKGIEMLDKLLIYNEYNAAVSMIFIRKRLLIKNKISFYPGIIHEDELFTFKLFFYSNTVVYLPEPLYNRRLRENSIMTSPIGKHNVISMFIVVDEMINSYLFEAKSDNDKKVIRIHINKILISLKSRYYQLPIKDRLILYNKVKELQSKLDANNYLNSLEVREKYQNIRIFDVKRAVKRIIPNRIKKMIKDIY